MSEARSAPFSCRWRLALGLAGAAVLAVSGVGAYLAASGPAPSGAVSGSVLPAAGAPRPVPELRFQGAQGNPVALSDFRGKTVLLNVWATWCVPCRDEMPALDRLQQQLGGPRFEVVALSIDSGGAFDVRRFYADLGLGALAIYVDPTMEASNKLRIVGVPTTLLIDAEGRERWRRSGPAQWDSPEIVQALRAQLRGEQVDGH